MKSLKKPRWIKKELFQRSEENFVKHILKDNAVHTICQEARCPNQGECFAKKSAAFLLLGNICTRNCRFCNIQGNNRPSPPDPEEPRRIADSVIKMGLKYVVLTSVTRDDLDDGGAGIFIRTVRLIKEQDPSIRIEVLVPDFKGDFTILQSLLNEDISVFNHNLETIQRLYPAVRMEADYQRSLDVLSYAAGTQSVPVKTGIMVGLGETFEEVLQLMDHIVQCGVEILTIGQYLQPSKSHYPVQEYLDPEAFKKYEEIGLKKGLKLVFSSPFVRSSYFSEKIYQKTKFKI